MAGWLFCVVIFLSACSTSRSVTVVKENAPFSGPAVANAHLGVCIYDPLRKQYLTQYDAEKYFVPASNTKILTLFGVLKTLGDSVPGVQYVTGKDSVFLLPTGDPSFLNRNFPEQPVFRFLKQQTAPLTMSVSAWKDNVYGPGWSWDDYEYSYMPERSPFPVYGNMIRWVQQTRRNEQEFIEDSLETMVYSEPDINWRVGFRTESGNGRFRIGRERFSNHFYISESREKDAAVNVPFITDTVRSGLELLADSLGKTIGITTTFPEGEVKTIYSRPIDSLLKPMMLYSDNFIAEQLMEMAAYKLHGRFDFEQGCNTILQNTFIGIPDTLSWVDGSGLSRLNLVTPRSMVWVLDQLQQQFGIERMKRLFATGGKGTLTGYYTTYPGRLFAKTGTLSGQVALSGYFYTKKDELRLFSVLVNNHRSSATEVRREVEKYLERWMNL